MAVRKITHGRGVSYEVTAVVDGKVVRKRFPTRKLAGDAYARIRQAGLDPTFVPAARSNITFADYSAEWLDGLQVRPNTVAHYRLNLTNHLIPALGPLRLDRIERPDVVRLVGQLSRSNLAPSTVRTIVNLLRTVMRSAVDDGRLNRSPCVRIGLPELPPKRLAVFHQDQTAALIGAVLPQHRALLLLALATGLRQGELLGVSEHYLNLVGGRLRVEQQLVTPGGPGEPYVTMLLKTKASRRVLPLPRFAVDALADHLRTQPAGRDGLLFTRPNGAPWRRGSFNESVWKPLLMRAELPRGYGMHALRHTYASGLITQNLHPKVIQERLGHLHRRDHGHLQPPVPAGARRDRAGTRSALRQHAVCPAFPAHAADPRPAGVLNAKHDQANAVPPRGGRPHRRESAVLRTPRPVRSPPSRQHEKRLPSVSSRG